MTTDPKDAGIARYDLDLMESRMVKDQWGVEWVRHSDHAAEIARLVAELAESEAAAEGAFMILAQTQAERDKAQTDLGRIIMSLPTGKGERAAGAVEGVKMMRARLEAERDAALAQVAGAYEAAAILPTTPEWRWRFEPHWSAADMATAIRALTPTDALAARDAQMRADGRKEGLREAAGIADQHNDAGYSAYSDGWHHCSRSIASAILAAAEREAGNG